MQLDQQCSANEIWHTVHTVKAHWYDHNDQSARLKKKIKKNYSDKISTWHEH